MQSVEAILGTKMDWKSHINSNGVRFMWHSGGQREIVMYEIIIIYIHR